MAGCPGLDAVQVQQLQLGQLSDEVMGKLIAVIVQLILQAPLHASALIECTALLAPGFALLKKMHKRAPAVHSNHTSGVEALRTYDTNC